MSERYIAEAVLYAKERAAASAPRLSQRAFHAQLRSRIRKIVTDEGTPIPIPAKTVRYDVVAGALRRAGTFDSTIKRQEGNASRSKREYGRVEATRPGEFILIDTTRLDVHGLSIFSSNWHHCELTIAMDLYSRTIVACRLSPVTTGGTDIALLLHDMLRPRREPWAFLSGRHLPTAGLPNHLLIDSVTGEFDDGTGDGNDLIPAITPETFVTDNGKVFVSEQFEVVCAALGINILRGRVVKASDKGQVETFFKTLRLDLLQYLAGFKGNEPGARGNHAEIDAAFSIEELDEIIRGYIMGYYHRTEHSGLSPFGVPGQRWSPLEKLKEGIARSGIRVSDRSKDLAVDLLPIKWVRIQHYGVQVSKLRYDADALKQYIGVRSNYRGHEGKWPIAFNPLDRQHAFFQDPATGEWHTLNWIGRDSFAGPFSTSMMMRSIQLSRSADGFDYARTSDDNAVADALNDYVARLDEAADLPPEDDRILLRVGGYREPLRHIDVSFPSLRSLFTAKALRVEPKHRADPPERQNTTRGRHIGNKRAKSLPDNASAPAADAPVDDYYEGTY